MAKTKKTTSGEKNIIAVEEALGKSEKFIEKNQNAIVWVIALIVIIIGGYIGYNRFILDPREKEASSEIFMAEKYFEEGEYSLALEGDGIYLGFLDIVDSYRMTKTANLANYYAGISYLKLGEFESAIEHLKKFKKRDQILGAMALGAIGDAYLELQDQNEAINYYKQAANFNSNKLTSPLFLFKAAQVKELMKDYNGALTLYERIKTDYHDSHEATEIELHIGRAKGHLK